MRQVKENRVLRVGDAREAAADFMARRLEETHPDFVEEFLGRHVGLVPTPKSVLHKPGTLWPALELAKALQRRGFGGEVLPILKRVQALPKSATSKARDRPKAREHFESLALEDAFFVPTEVTIIDDVLTRGATLLGAAARIALWRPEVVIRAFAVIRTISDPEDFDKIRDPVIGVIKLSGDDCYRTP